jgi:branched-chain amino acid transport system ATP-binding protein
MKSREALDGRAGLSTAVSQTDAVLSVESVSLRFGGTRALRSVSFDVTDGELFAIIGPNGAGKTSIFNCVSGLYRPQEGSIRSHGTELVGVAPTRVARLGIARMFQNIALFDNMTVLDNLMLGRHLHIDYSVLSALLHVGAARREEVANRRAVEEVVELLELEPYRRQPVGMLPYGVKKRVELGRALATEPRLLLLDEPVAGMNVEETEDMARFILDVRAEKGTTMVLVEHDMGLVMDLADRVMVLDFGELISLGTPAAVQEDPAVVRAYLGQDMDGDIDEDPGFEGAADEAGSR